MTSTHGTARAVAALLAVSGAWLALSGHAVAAPGQIGYDACLASTTAKGCADLPGTPLDIAEGVAVSPDGRSVYVASHYSGSIAHFFRGGQGQLTYDGCLANPNPVPQGCAELLGAPIGGAAGVAVSPDGRSVYVASWYSGSIANFTRNGPQGQIAYVGCLNNDGAQLCSDLPGTPLGNADAVAVSPDGRSVYVVSHYSQSIAHFFRGGQGQLTYDGCLANPNSVPHGCADLLGAPLSGPFGVAVSPDGSSVYVASDISGSIALFSRNGPQGQIAYVGCLNNDGAQLCSDLPGAPLVGAYGVAVSPDGRSVYVAGAGGSIAHFRRGGQGQLSYDGCLASAAAPGCADLPGTPLEGASGVAVSPDGRSVYVTSYGSGSIAHFFRGGQGRLTYDGCLASDDAPGCGNLPGAPLDGAYGVAVSPSGRSVYVVSQTSNSIAHFFRALGDGPPPGSVTTPGTRQGRQGGRIGFGSKTLITLKLAAKRIPARGPVPIVVTNANGFTVGGRLSGETARPVAAKLQRRVIKLRSKTFRVAARRKTTVRLRLPTTLSRLLKRNGRIKLRLRANLRDPAGKARTVTKTLTPRLKQKRKRTAA